MERRDRQVSAGTLAEVRGRLNAWRRATGARGRIPEALWRAAVDLARAQGAPSVSEALRLDAESLKRRLKAARPQDDSRRPPVAPTFVEVELPPPGASQESVVELEDQAGTRLRVRLSRAGAVDVAAIAKELWGARA